MEYKNSEDFAKAVHSALKLEVPYQERDVRPSKLRPKPKKITPASVLAIFGFYEGKKTPFLLLTQRTQSVETHKGQVAFPGGACDPEDRLQPDSEIYTALRETEEEIGIQPTDLRILGKLPQVQVLVSGFSVTPVMGLLKTPIEKTAPCINPDEIETIFWISLNDLLKPENYKVEWFSVKEVQYSTPVFTIGEHYIWGATGILIKNIVDRLKQTR